MTEETFGPYRIGQLLGRGGMGEVHRAYDTVHDRFVALKRLSTGNHSDAEYRARFRREARIVARLREPHVIPIHAYGEIDGRLYLDMRLVEGSDLSDVIREGAIEPARAVRIVEQVASALDAAHADGLVHRDVKPSNVLVTPGDFVYLVDFGIARSVSPSATGLTASGSVVGTLDYMAPERFEGGPVDGRADVYALACVLFACLTGRRPFTADGTAAQIWAHLYVPPPRTSSLNPAIPAALDDVIARGMAKKPADRYATAGAFARAAAEAAATPAPEPLREALVAVEHKATVPVRPEPDPPTVAVPGTESRVEQAVLVAATLVVLAGMVAISLYFGNGDKTSGSGSTTTTTTSSTTTATTTTTRSPQVDSLLAALPTVYRGDDLCAPVTPDGGAVAAVRCTESNSWNPREPPPDEAEFRLFGDRAALDAYFQSLVTSRGIPRIDEAGRCRPKIDPIHYTLYRRTNSSGPLPGEFATCFVDGGNAQVWWVDTRTLTIGAVKRSGDINTLDSLDIWWSEKVLATL
ncbi:serine/threonine-protein kinase [Lentzea sp. NEAU-D7]|uniref:serine/threonine-protein kinase n=1 Tax=Lentzea sp. NEAU-D7 TaxID=2994667 RepID=UPI00224B24A0|nr:serine/threonine-protein kinase [Lentzea sp. NEAU-D7]MCX2951569.1 serine/threonine-protein kinase [Lentzea sp. NEAU-D7]